MKKFSLKVKKNEDCNKVASAIALLGHEIIHIFPAFNTITGLTFSFDELRKVEGVESVDENATINIP